VHKQVTLSTKVGPLYVLVPVRIVVAGPSGIHWAGAGIRSGQMCRYRAIEDKRLGRGRVAAGIGGVAAEGHVPMDACRRRCRCGAQAAVVDRRASGIGGVAGDGQRPGP